MLSISRLDSKEGWRWLAIKTVELVVLPRPSPVALNLHRPRMSCLIFALSLQLHRVNPNYL